MGIPEDKTGMVYNAMYLDGKTDDAFADVNHSTLWGTITGSISSQTDLSNALAAKANTTHSHAPSEITGTAVITSDSRLTDARTPTTHDNTKHSASYIVQSNAVVPNGAITGATNTKITYDAKGLVTGGSAATTADISDSSDRRYCTDAQKAIIGNTSGTNSGDNSANSSTMYIGTTAHTLNRGSGPETIAGLTLTTPNIGAATGTSLAATGALTSSGGGLGYATGAGGAVTQLSSRTTGVTLSKLCGNITMFSAAQGAQAIVTFTLTNTFIAAGDMIIVRHISATNGGAWNISCVAGSGSATITIRNVTTASITEATPLRFTIIKGVTS
jgi:hypothetical protein